MGGSTSCSQPCHSTDDDEKHAAASAIHMLRFQASTCEVDDWKCIASSPSILVEADLDQIRQDIAESISGEHFPNEETISFKNRGPSSSSSNVPAAEIDLDKVRQFQNGGSSSSINVPAAEIDLDEIRQGIVQGMVESIDDPEPPESTPGSTLAHSRNAAEAASFKLHIGRRYGALVLGAPGINIIAAVESKVFNRWAISIGEVHCIELTKLFIQSADMLGQSLECVKFRADAFFGGKRLPGSVTLRGGTVAILMIFHHDEKRYTLIVRQPRIPVCRWNFPEIPAGAFDVNGNFVGNAAREISEELGFEIKVRDLLEMTHVVYRGKYVGVFPSCDGSDEFHRLFVYQKNISTSDLEGMLRRLTGVPLDGQTTTLQIIPLEALWRTCPDAKSLTALCLYEKLDSAGLVPTGNQFLV